MQGGVVALVDDLMFASRIAEATRPAGTASSRFRSPEALLEHCRAVATRLVILDLDADRLRPLQALETIRADPALAGIRVVGFVSHVDAARTNAARAAGCEVLSRGEFVRALPGLAADAGS